MFRGSLLVLLIILPVGVAAMPFKNPLKVCVFSSVTAQLTIAGEPLKNAAVIQRWEWQNPLQERRTTTDEQGRFSFPAIYESSITRLLPIEMVIAQGLYVEIDGQEQQFWLNSKLQPQENGELKGKPLSLICELTKEKKITREFGSILSTVCTWE